MGKKEKEPIFVYVDRNKELRCPGSRPSGKKCNKLLALGDPGTIEIKCPRCGLLCRFQKLL